MALRNEQSLITSWIEIGSRVLDLGCGDGALLAYLRRERKVRGYGIEIDPENIIHCVNAGVSVLHSDLDAGLGDFRDHSFDYVIMTQTLQAMRYPHRLLAEMLRVGHTGIVTFPNMGYWKCRLQMAFGGRMPVSRTLPHQWYDTPNLHLCTLLDFETLCAETGIRILERRAVDHVHRSGLGRRLVPNLLGEIAIYRVCRAHPAA